MLRIEINLLIQSSEPIGFRELMQRELKLNLSELQH